MRLMHYDQMNDHIKYDRDILWLFSLLHNMGDGYWKLSHDQLVKYRSPSPPYTAWSPTPNFRLIVPSDFLVLFELNKILSYYSYC